MSDFDWDSIWQGIVAIFVLSLLTLALTISLETKNVDYYYFTNFGNGSAQTCAYAHWTWHNDEKAFCDNDEQKVMDFVVKANTTLPRK